MNNELELLALELYDGEGRSGLICPTCKGGFSFDKSFSIKRDGHKVFYRCWRNSCGSAGKLNLSSGSMAAAKREVTTRRREFALNTDPLSKDNEEYLRSKWHLTASDIRKWDITETTKYSIKGTSRVYVPIRRLNGTTRGYIVRDVSGLDKPKALSFLFREDEPILAWFPNRKSSKLILVEDVFSAIRASKYMNAAALLGTHVDDKKVDDIIRGGFSTAYLALDKDATRKAIIHAIKWRSRINFTVIELEKDLKDQERKELDYFMEKLV